MNRCPPKQASLSEPFLPCASLRREMPFGGGGDSHTFGGGAADLGDRRGFHSSLFLERERLARILTAQQFNGRGPHAFGLALVLAQLSATGMGVGVRRSYSDGQGPNCAWRPPLERAARLAF